MERPYIICHMLTSLDGKIIGDYLEVDRATYFVDEYENIPSIPRTDYVAKKDAETYAIAVDPSGKLGWTKSYISEGSKNRAGDHIVEVLTEEVSDAYLAYLRNLRISYIFGGKGRLDFTIVVEKLKKLFLIDELILEGGGYLNGSFMNEGLIDELSLVLVPIADGASNAVTLFETSPYLKKQSPLNFQLKNVEKLEDDGLWMKYVTKRD